MARIAIVTDAWTPQVNGVVRTLTSTVAELERLGHAVAVVPPDRYRNVPCPTYPSIRLALAGPRAVGRALLDFEPTHIHIATEGPLGVAARRWCLRRGWRFTTAYHTNFPEYAALRTRLPASLFWRYIRWFHRPSARVLASTRSVRDTLAKQGVGRTAHWGRGVDLDLFSPRDETFASYEGLARPIQLFVGRVAVEKNIEAFLGTSQGGTKVVVGDGPLKSELERRYPDVKFLAALHGRALANAYAAAEVFVFPSRTDTFGLVIVEALASGVPVAAYPVTGPIDLITSDVGALDQNLDDAVARALECDREACAKYARSFTWAASTQQFLSALVEVEGTYVARMGSKGFDRLSLFGDRSGSTSRTG